MITLFDAIKGSGWGLILAPFFLLFCIASEVKYRRLRKQSNQRFISDRRLFEFKAGVYICIIIFLVSLIKWYALYETLRFDWDRSDVKEIEVLVFSEPYPRDKPLIRLVTNDPLIIEQIFDGLESLEFPDQTGHSASTGKAYTLRLLRQSDNKWSHYSLALDSDVEYSNELIVKGVYNISILKNNSHVARYQARELGLTINRILLKDTGDNVVQ